jgi:pantoate kinase
MGQPVLSKIHVTGGTVPVHTEMGRNNLENLIKEGNLWEFMGLCVELAANGGSLSKIAVEEKTRDRMLQQLIVSTTHLVGAVNNLAERVDDIEATIRMIAEFIRPEEQKQEDVEGDG